MSTLQLLRRASGAPLFTGLLKTEPTDFVVHEVLGFDPDGDGEHDLLWIEKTGTNTDWLARQLARHAGIPAKDVGYGGLKDRHAVTRQWFSVRRPDRDGTDWDAFRVDGVRILESHRHRRKLRTGSHRANRFDILLRTSEPPSTEALQERGRTLISTGAPNYFGDQRFGRDGANLSLAEDLFSRKGRIDRKRRGFALSAVRSYLFNEILNQRVVDGTWNQLQAGDLAELAGTSSVFAVTDVDDNLRDRCRSMDIHPTATLWGQGAPKTAGDVAALENEIAGRTPGFRDGLVDARVDAGHRRLRMSVPTLELSIARDGVRLGFELGRGEYATMLLQEIADVQPSSSST